MPRRGRRPLPGAWRAARFIALGVISQRSLIFRPSRKELGTPAGLVLGYESHSLNAGRHGKIRAWWVLAPLGGPTVILFPGRKSNISYHLMDMQFLHSLGATTLAVDYPGFGASEGRPSEEGCRAAAEAAWLLATVEKDFEPEEVILYGRSLGASVAAWLASRRRCRGLVFHGGFSSLPDIAACYLPAGVVHWFCRTSLDSRGRIADCHCPLLVLHARCDRLVPFHLAALVYDQAPGPKRLIELEGDHDDTRWLYHPGTRRSWEEMLAGTASRWFYEDQPLPGSTSPEGGTR